MQIIYAKTLEEILRHRHMINDFLCIVEKPLPRLGQMDPLSLDVDELDPELGFQTFDLLRYRGLSDEKFLGGDTEALFLANKIEKILSAED